jgi:tripartite-type tricarboxylate transporter receptor subunit TctC
MTSTVLAACLTLAGACLGLVGPLACDNKGRAKDIPAATTSSATPQTASPASAQDSSSGLSSGPNDAYPSHPVTLVCPYPPGGGIDLLAQALHDPLERALKQPVTVSYRTGSAAAIGTGSVAHAAADGYTILIGAASTVTIPEVDHLLERPPSYALDELTAVALLTDEPPVLIVHPSLPAKNAAEFIALAKAHPGELIVSSGGFYGPSHLPMLLLERAAGVRFKHLVGTGGGPAMSALLSGNAVAYAGLPSIITPHVQAGRARALAHCGTGRLPGFPDVPSFKEMGIDLQFSDWFAVFAPAKTPPPVLKTLREALRAAAGDTHFRDAMARMNQAIDYRDDDDFQAWYAHEAKWRVDAVRAIGKIDTK